MNKSTACIVYFFLSLPCPLLPPSFFSPSHLFFVSRSNSAIVFSTVDELLPLGVSISHQVPSILRTASNSQHTQPRFSLGSWNDFYSRRFLAHQFKYNPGSLDQSSCQISLNLSKRYNVDYLSLHCPEILGRW